MSHGGGYVPTILVDAFGGDHMDGVIRRFMLKPFGVKAYVIQLGITSHVEADVNGRAQLAPRLQQAECQFLHGLDDHES